MGAYKIPVQEGGSQIVEGLIFKGGLYGIIIYKQGGLLRSFPAAPDSVIFNHITTCIRT